MKFAAPHLCFGAQGEQLAATFLRNNGYNIIGRNWRFGHLEIDLICECCGWIIFVEVKTRRSHTHGGAVGAVTASKQKKLIKAAQAWLGTHKLWHKPCRFDIVCLTGNDGRFSVEHYRNAFDLSKTVDRCHSHWQSW